MPQRDRTSWRLPADARRGAPVRGVLVKRANALFLVTSDHRRKVIGRVYEVGAYTTPRHTPGTRMKSYRAFLHGLPYLGRSAGRMLTLRRAR